MRPAQRTAADLLPPLAGLALVILFTGLGFWQLERAEEKRAIEAAFSARGDYRQVTANADYPLYQPLAASGRWVGERQFLIDNSILNGRVGYYVVTPFEYASGAPLLLVNRGWLPKDPGGNAAEVAERTLPPAGSEPLEVTGLAGRLPRVGIRAGEAFTADAGWPRIANWPTLDELAAALGQPVLPFVLLADPEEGSPFVRQWQPQQAGPARHIGYAFQWFALATAVIVLAIVLYRKRRVRN